MTGNCHCFCQKLHPAEMGICDNVAVTTTRFNSALTGPRDVPLCAACATAGTAFDDELQKLFGGDSQ